MKDFNSKDSIKELGKALRGEIGEVHSIESMGAVDGPGIRTVVFMQGCLLNCKYCHNVDCVPVASEKAGRYTPEKLAAKILKNKPYWGKNSASPYKNDSISGGVTFSGGEPTMQADFVTAACQILKKENVHIALDTCLFTSKTRIAQLLPLIDLWMISLKQLDDETHQFLTGVSNKLVLENIKLLDEQITNMINDPEINPNKLTPKIRIRFVLIPGYTDSADYLKRIAQYCNKIKNFELIEILPYVTIGKFKWIEMYGKYPFEGVAEPSQEQIQTAIDIMKAHNIAYKI